VEPEVLVVCAYGVLIKEPLLSYEILNVHPSLLPRWRGAAPVERAIMAGDAETGVAIMRLTAGLDSGPVCLVEREPIRADDDYGLALRAASRPSAGGAGAGAGRAAAVCGAGRGRRHLRAQDRGGRPRARPDAARPRRSSGWCGRCGPTSARACRSPDGSYLGVVRAEVDGETLAPAGGHVRTDGERLLLDCNGGALELTEIQPPGARRCARPTGCAGGPTRRSPTSGSTRGCRRARSTS
jgi:methionyl-tRNA formyltransferase